MHFLLEFSRPHVHTFAGVCTAIYLIWLSKCACLHRKEITMYYVLLQTEVDISHSQTKERLMFPISVHCCLVLHLKTVRLLPSSKLNLIGAGIHMIILMSCSHVTILLLPFAFVFWSEQSVIYMWLHYCIEHQKFFWVRGSILPLLVSHKCSKYVESLVLWLYYSQN